jgi:hypothetical protein
MRLRTRNDRLKRANMYSFGARAGRTGKASWRAPDVVIWVIGWVSWRNSKAGGAVQRSPQAGPVGPIQAVAAMPAFPHRAGAVSAERQRYDVLVLPLANLVVPAPSPRYLPSAFTVV